MSENNNKYLAMPEYIKSNKEREKAHAQRKRTLNSNTFNLEKDKSLMNLT